MGPGLRPPRPGRASDSPGAALDSRESGGGAVPGPSRRSTNRRRTRSRQEAREGGAGPPGNPSLSGPHRAVGGGASA